MANREITYYSLLSSENLRHIESVADEMSEKSFVSLGFEKKWLTHLWIGANNEAFLQFISHQTDLKKLDRILGEQLKLYARKQGEGFEQNKGEFYSSYKARKDWIKNTIFISKNEYNKTINEVFNEVVEWCEEWCEEWLETFNPYSPTERQEMVKDLKKPIWAQLNKSSPPQTKSAELFEDIFTTPDWEKYIMALNKTEPPILDDKFVFIGRPKLHKGVVCSWIKHLQDKGLIKPNINRSQLASVLNKELKDFNLGKDGKTFDNVSNEYEKNFKNQLSDLVK